MNNDRTSRAVGLALGLTAVFFVVEIVGGLLSGSLALLADAGHMASDVAALLVSLITIRLAQRPHTGRSTYGWHRAETLGALVNGLLLLGVGVSIVWEAVERLNQPRPIAAGPMLAVAVVGLLVNVVALRALRPHAHSDATVHGAFLHVAGDALSSVAVLGAGVVVLTTGVTVVDPLASIGIAALVGAGAVRLVADAVSVLLEASPPHVDLAAVQGDLAGLAGVTDVHDLHVWSVSTGFVSLSAHARLVPEARTDEVLRSATEMLRARHGISHVTIQPEYETVHGEEHCCLDHTAHV